MKYRGLIGATILLYAGCASAADFHLAAVQSLTGAYASVGVPYANGLRLALDKVNASGVLGSGNRIVLDVQDTASERAQAITLVNRFGGDQKTLLIFGPTTTIEVLAAGPAAQAAKVPQITLTATDQAKATNPLLLHINVAVTTYMGQLGDFAVEKLGVKNCAFLTANDNEGYMLQYRSVRAAILKGASTVADEFVKGSETNFAAVATKIVAQNPDCVAINLTPESTANSIIQLKEAGLAPTARIITSNSAASQAFLNTGGAAVEGAYLVSEFAPPGTTPEARKFTKDYTRRFGDSPNNWAALGYSAMQVTAAALGRISGPASREKLFDALTATQDAAVVVGNGKLSISPDRQTTFQTSILTVKDGKFVAP